MKTIIAGSRNITDYDQLLITIENSGFTITEVVSGGARGVDKLGEKWAKTNFIPIKRFEPKWDEYGKAAGIIRNVAMAHYAEALIALWDGKSKGTHHMIQEAHKQWLEVHWDMYVPG